MVIDKELLDNLTEKAKESPRLRMNYDLRNSSQDSSQRMLNALEPGTFIPIHRHMSTSESVVILRGSAKQYFYDNNGNIDEVITITAGSDCPAMNVEMSRWHRMESLESGTVILESKDGAYFPAGEDDFFIKVLQKKIAQLMEMEAKSCSMDSNLVTPEYVYIMWSGQVPQELICEAMKDM